jgi:ABC-type multidrug transport system ATPase subunit
MSLLISTPLQMVLRAEHIYKSFGKNQVLRDLFLEVDPGSLCGIVGENGSGKSTLLKILVGEWKPGSGTVQISGRLGYCPQRVTLYPQLSVNEHFSYFGAAYGMTGPEQRNSQAHLLEYFNFGKYLGEKVAHLSGGTAQKLNLSLALLHKPKLLILDEPYSGFDWYTYQRFWGYVSKLREEGCAILVVSHFITEKELFDRIYEMKNGQLQ